jgi:hypothetical protein
MSNNKRLRRISIVVNARTAHNLDLLAKLSGLGSSGRVVDKLTQARMIELRIGGRTYEERVQ